MRLDARFEAISPCEGLCLPKARAHQAWTVECLPVAGLLYPGRTGWAMELAFRTRTLRSICQDEEVAAAALDPVVLDHLRNRLADLLAASSIEELIVGQPRVEDGDPPRLVVELGPSHQLICSPNHLKSSPTPGGDLDWRRVRRLQIIAIEERSTRA